MSAALQPADPHAVLARGSRSFAFAARFLDGAARDDAARIYAFCRRVDDLADEEDAPAAERHRALLGIRDQLTGKAPPEPVVADLLAVHARRSLDLGAAVALVEGCATDTGLVRLADDRALLRYCHGVASTVGLLMCGVLGVDDPRARPFAVDLGVAMQLTNLCRDVAQDARNGRIYLPATRLAAAGVSPESLLDGHADPRAVAVVVRDLLSLAERYYASAFAGLRFIPLRARLAILVAARVYRRIGRALLDRGGDALSGRTVVPLSDKIAEAARAVLQLFTPALLGIGPAPAHDARLHEALDGLPGTHVLRESNDVLLDQDRRRDDPDPQEHPHRLGAAPWRRPAEADLLGLPHLL